jgi:hypothetical protein
MKISRIPLTQTSPRTLNGTKAVEQPGTDRRHGNSRQAGQRFVNDRQFDVRGLQEIIRSERTPEKSRSCVTRAAALIANALAA